MSNDFCYGLACSALSRGASPPAAALARPLVNFYSPNANNSNMLDTKSALVLKILQKECHGSGYKVIDKSDIISSLPAKYKMSEDTLDHIITFLERSEYIHIKYDDENVYCLCVLNEIGPAAEKESKKEKPKMWLFLILTAFFSLIGGLLGSIIAKYISF